MIDWKRNNKIALRNFHESIDFHDIVKTLLVRMLRRKHPNNKACQIYTEKAVEGNFIPDIEMFLKKKYRYGAEHYVYELQDNISKSWMEKIKKRYEDVNLIIVPLKEIEKKWKGGLEELRVLLKDYII